MSVEFVPFPKLYRFNRPVIITEKIDGTNASVYVPDDPSEPLLFGSRTRWVTPENDNYGFARWGTDHADELRELGPGHHFGEWWGAGIQRKYGMQRKRFSLFNTSRWEVSRPACCDVVPVLGSASGLYVESVMNALQMLRDMGSYAAPGFMNPEGIVVYHPASSSSFKFTLDGDGHKGNAKSPRGITPEALDERLSTD